MKIFIIIFALIPGLALSNEDSERAELHELSDYINHVNKQSVEEIDFRKLSINLNNLRQPYRFSLPERYFIYQNYQEEIIKIKNYSEIFRDRLTKIYDDRLAMPSNSNAYQSATSSLSVETSIASIALESLPTKETVVALADLYDYTKFDPRSADDAHLPAESIPMLAGKILNQLPIKNRPTPHLDPILSHGQEIKDMVEKWRLWCKDVKAGKIEPEFGPEVFVNGDSIPPIAMRHQIRSPKPAPVKIQLSDSATSSSEFYWPWITAAGAATLLAGYAAWKVKKNKRG